MLTFLFWLLVLPVIVFLVWVLLAMVLIEMIRGITGQ